MSEQDKQATRIRAMLSGDVTEVRLLMQHRMETGRRKGPSGDPFPAHYIAEFKVLHKDRVVLEGEFSTAISSNPYLSFTFSGGALGDEISVKWRDNLGESRRDTGVIGAV